MKNGQSEPTNEALTELMNDQSDWAKFNKKRAQESFLMAAAFAGGLAMSTLGIVDGEAALGIPAAAVSGFIAYASFKDGQRELETAMSAQGLSRVAEYRLSQ